MLIIAPCGPESITECFFLLLLNCTYLSSVILYRLIRVYRYSRCNWTLNSGSILRATCLMATRFKATTPKCASGKVPGNTTALCADRLWINVVIIAVPGTYNCIIMFDHVNSFHESTYSFSTASHWSRQSCPVDCCMRSHRLQHGFE